MCSQTVQTGPFLFAHTFWYNVNDLESTWLSHTHAIFASGSLLRFHY